MDIHQFSYKIKNVELTLDINYALKDTAPIYLNIISDYINRKMPVIQFGIQLDTQIIQKVYKYKDTAKIKLEIIEYEYFNDELVASRRFLQHTFNIIPTREITSYVTASNIQAQEDMDPSSKIQAFEMYLVDMDFVNVFTKEISTIFRDCSKPSALECLFTMRDIPAKVVVATPPHDINIIKQIIIPIGDLVSNIDILNKSYGLYSSYPIIYYDLHYLYCIDRITPNIVIPSIVDFNAVTFIIKNSNDPEAKIPGGYNDLQSKTHYINLQGAPSIIDKSTQINSTQFATIQSIDTNGDISKVTLNDSSTKLNYIYKHNDLTIDQEINEKYRTDMIVSFIIADSPISIFRPYKTYRFLPSSEHSELKLDNKEFRLSTTSFSMQRSGTDFTHTISVNLYKI